MKLANQLSYIGLVLLFMLASCSIEKRIYRPGYHIEWKNRRQNSDYQVVAKKDKVKQPKQNHIATIKQSEKAGNTTGNIFTVNDGTNSTLLGNANIPILTTPSQQKGFNKGTKHNIIPGNFSTATNVKNEGKYRTISSYNEGGRGFSITSFVSGIVGLFFGALIFGTIAVVFGIIGLNKDLKGLAIAGLILGIIEVILGLIVIAILL